MKDTTIEWTTHTWNPVTGCTRVSPGCDNCYAEAIALRFAGGAGFPRGFDVTLKPHKLREPLRWREPSLVFVNSMSDLFHREIPVDYLGQIWSMMLGADQHIYQVLTKRPHRAAELIRRMSLPLPPHIWLGVSVENQRFAENRIPALLSIPAQVRWLSCEPLLGDLDLREWLPSLDWVVDGGESGSGRRPADESWFRSIREQCRSVAVPYFHKQGNAHISGRDRELDGRTWDEYPSVEHPALSER